MNVGIWIRVSTEDQARGESPRNHEHRARMYAELKGWTIIELYDMSGVSGKSILEHPETKRMLADVAGGKIKSLIFSKLARLARNTKDLLDIADHFQKHNANLVSLEESIDTSTPAGRLLFTVIGALAQWEREEISARVAASIPVRAKMGRNTGGFGPFGYQWIDGKLIVNPKEAPVVRAIYDTYQVTKAMSVTAAKLNAQGYRTKRGAKFGNTTLKRILTDQTYKGIKRANYSKSKGAHKSWTLKPEKDWVFFQVEPLVSEQLWNEVNAVIKQRAEPFPSVPPQVGKYAFAGLLTCGHCNKRMYVEKYQGMKSPRYRCRSCHEKINEDILVDQFKEGLRSLVVGPDQLQAATREETNEVADLEARAKTQTLELKAVGRKIDNIIELWSEKVIDKATFAEKFETLKERREQLQREIPRIEGEVAFIKTSELGKDHILTQATTLHALWDTLDYPSRIKIAKELLSGIVYKKNELTFEYIYLPELMPLGNPDQTHRGSWPRRASATRDKLGT